MSRNANGARHLSAIGISGSLAGVHRASKKNSHGSSGTLIGMRLTAAITIVTTIIIGSVPFDKMPKQIS